MDKDRVAITVRISSELKFLIDKEVATDGNTTINAWIVNLIKRELENKGKK